MNRGTDTILSVYSDARAEYTKQLCVFLVPAYFQFFIELLEKAKQSMVTEPKRALWQFQNYLNEIHDWNMEKVNSEIQRIYTNCGCDYLEDLLTAVFIAHTKVLTAIRLSANKKKIEINVPKVEHFLFKVLCESSKLLWSSTYLFRDGISGIEKQQNYRNIEQILNEGILQAVRSLVPVKSILKDFVNHDGDDTAAGEEEESDDEKEEVVEKENKSEPSADITTPASIPVDIPQVSTIDEKTSEIHTPPEIQSPPLEPKNEVIMSLSEPIEQTHQPPTQQMSNPPTIVIDDKPTVKFGEFDAVFDSDNPNQSDMIFDPKDEDDEVPAIEILDDAGVPLSEGLDFDDLDDNKSDNLELDDYEELN